VLGLGLARRRGGCHRGQVLAVLVTHDAAANLVRVRVRSRGRGRA